MKYADCAERTQITQSKIQLISPFSKGGLRRICYLLFAIYYLPFTLYAGDKGTSGAQFLKIGVGARAAAMGEAYAGMEGDINSIYWNPAGLSKINTPQTSFSHIAWFQNIKHENLTVGYPTSSGFMALGINYLTAGKIDKYDNLGAETGGSYAPTDMLITFAYSKKIKNVSIGSNLKYISSNIDGENAAALGADLGGIYRKNKLNIGLSVQNLGTKMKFAKNEYSLPLNIKLGGIYKFGRSFIAALDFNIPNDNDFRVNTGVEYNRKCGKNLTVALRTGYKTNTKGLDTIDGLSFGFGMGYKNSRLDYAWVPYGDLGNTHRLSFVYMMGEKVIRKKRKELPQVKEDVGTISNRTEEVKENPENEEISLDEEIRQLEQELFKKGEIEKKPLSPEDTKKIMRKHFDTATQLYQKGKYKESITEWEKVLKLDPVHKLSLQKMEKAKEKLKK